MQLVAFLTVACATFTVVWALPPQWAKDHIPAPILTGPGPLHSIEHGPWQRHLEVREAMPEPVPEAMPEALPEAMPEALPEALPEAMPVALPAAMPEALPEAMPEPAPHPVPDAEFIPTLVQRSPASEGKPEKEKKEKKEKNPPGYPGGPAPGPTESVSHQPWKRALPDAENIKRDVTELIELQDHQLIARDAIPEALAAFEALEARQALEARRPTPTKEEKDEKAKPEKEKPTKPKWPPGYSGFPVGPIESVSHQPWKRHIEQDTIPAPQPAIVLTA